LCLFFVPKCWSLDIFRFSYTGHEVRFLRLNAVHNRHNVVRHFLFMVPFIRFMWWLSQEGTAGREVQSIERRPEHRRPAGPTRRHPATLSSAGMVE
jgi:hypothetical protein